MSTTTTTRSRRGLALGLAVLGLAGLSLASAAQLDLTDDATFQTGAVALTADCQGATAIPVSFGVPARTGNTYNATTVTFSGIANACAGMRYKAAVRTGASTWTDLADGTVSATSIAAALPAGVPANSVAEVALTIYHD